MILGKIEVKVENLGGPKYLYCRPISNGQGREFPSRIGTAHVVWVEKNIETRSLQINDIIIVFGIFSYLPTEEEFERGFLRLQVNPVSEEIYNGLKDLYPQKEHPFLA